MDGAQFVSGSECRRDGHGVTTEAWVRRSIRPRSSSRLATRVVCSTSFSERPGETTNDIILPKSPPRFGQPASALTTLFEIFVDNFRNLTALSEGRSGWGPGAR